MKMETRIRNEAPMNTINLSSTHLLTNSSTHSLTTHPLTNSSTHSLIGRVASLLEVGTGFHPELTGRENIYFNGAILGMTKQEIDNKINSMRLWRLLILAIFCTTVKNYSSGMFVSLGFAGAVHSKPDILLVAELLAVRDIK